MHKLNEKKEVPVFTKILFPTDFSDTAGKSLQYIKELRKAGAQKIVLLNVIHQRILRFPGINSQSRLFSGWTLRGRL